jgi:hypothetical protein
MNMEALRGCSGLDREEIAVMGSVLAFAPRDAATSRKPLAAGDTASIVIFPGIRYERHETESRDTAVNRAESQRDKPRPGPRH